MKRDDITTVQRQATHVRKLFDQAKERGKGNGPGGTFRQGLRYIVGVDDISTELAHQLEGLWKTIECLENDE